MKIKSVVFVFSFFYSSLGGAAFSSVENNQLLQINENSSEELRLVMMDLKKAVSKQVKSNPENEVLITSLNNAWQGMIEKKCQLETAESKGTEAEIAEVNDCLVRNVREEIDYFNSMLP